MNNSQSLNCNTPEPFPILMDDVQQYSGLYSDLSSQYLSEDIYTHTSVVNKSSWLIEDSVTSSLHSHLTDMAREVVIAGLSEVVSK